MYKTVCKYCGGTEHVSGSHLKLCPFNPRNNKLILNFLKNLFIDDKPLVLLEYNKFARENKLPKTSTLSIQFRNNFLDKDASTVDIFIYLIYRSYELNLISDLEILDLIVYQLTYGNFGLSAAEYLDRRHKISIKAGVSEDVLYASLINFKNAISNF